MRLDASVTRKFAASIGELNTQIRQVLRGRSQCDYQSGTNQIDAGQLLSPKTWPLEAKDYFSSGLIPAFYPYEGGWHRGTADRDSLHA